MAFEPENDLERLLVAAARDPREREKFVRALLDAQVFVALFGPTPDAALVDPATNTLRAGLKLTLRSIERDGVTCLPFFSAASRVWAMTRDNHVVTPTTGRALFRDYAGLPFILNPGAEFGKEFLPAEVGDLLAGRIGAPPQTIAFPSGGKALIGSPADYPAALVARLGSAFAALPDIKAATLAYATMPGQQPGLLLELASAADRRALLAKVGPILQAAAPPARPVNVHVVTEAEAMLSRGIVKPFYIA